MAKKSRSKSYAQETAEKGAFATFWGQKYGLSVYPAYGIDKIKFSFMPLKETSETDANGKPKKKVDQEHTFDVYMDTIKDGTACFDNWADDALNDIMFKILAQEKQAGEQYPKEYKYMTGDNAEKSVGICNSKAGGYLINASALADGNKKIFANIQVTRGDLRRLAKRFKETYKGRVDELNQIMIKAATDFRNRIEEEPPAPAAQPEVETETKAPEEETKPVEAESRPSEKPKNEAYELRLRSRSALTPAKKGSSFYMQAVTQDGEEKTIRFTEEAYSKVENVMWGSFLNKTKKEGCTFTALFKNVQDNGAIDLDFVKFPA